MKRKTNKERLQLWQTRLASNDSAYAAQEKRMDQREEMYRGSDRITAVVEGDKKTKTPHVRNICAELIEAQVDSNIPQPKVTALRKGDEMKAKLIEDMIRGELDRLPMEQINDMMERTVPIQGGAALLLEWDNTQRTHTTVGELAVTVVHPKQIVPQDGVFTGIEDMDYIILKVPQTKGYIRRRYGVDLTDETELEPDIKGSDDQATAEDLVTQYVGYYRNEEGGIGLYSWVGEHELEDLEDYQTRRLRRCAKCGAVEPMETTTLDEPTMDGTPPEEAEEHPAGHRGSRKICPYCGASQWEESAEEYEEIFEPILRSDGSMIPGAVPMLRPSETELDELGMPIVEVYEEPTRVPFYKPDIYPLFLQKNVSVYGSFLGDSDIDKIANQQNTTNRLSAKIIDKLMKSGSYITLPSAAQVKRDAEDMKIIYPGNAAEKSLIDVYTMEADVSQDLAYLAQVYEEARQVIGITDSFQGRKDATATSGKAKEFSAAQSAGRLESKRVMKNAAYAAFFEGIFKFALAYADEPRPVVAHDIHGNAEYAQFNRYDFLEQDSAGEWYWNDRFLFSTDTAAPLASNREAMWQETRMNLQTGAFGDPTNINTLILFWTKMEMLHYPGAGETKTYLEEEQQKQQLQMQAQMQLQQQMAAQAQMAQAMPTQQI